jgi:ABC-2 type transport system ATP-binding protein
MTDTLPSPTPREREAVAAPALLQATDLTKRQKGDALALDAVTLTVHAGEIYCLLGAAGAGKTLVLHAFLGLAVPTAGRVLVAGTDSARDPVGARRHITYIARGASLYGSLTARQNVEFFTRVDGREPKRGRHEYYNAMRRVGIPERSFERPARELSRSVSLSLWLAIGLLRNTSVLLIDEPTVGLDLYASAELQDTLIELRQRGKALLVATADVLFAGRIADRVGIMKEGRKSVELSRDAFVNRSLSDLYLEYMGRTMSATTGSRDG